MTYGLHQRLNLPAGGKIFHSVTTPSLQHCLRQNKTPCSIKQRKRVGHAPDYGKKHTATKNQHQYHRHQASFTPAQQHSAGTGKPACGSCISHPGSAWTPRQETGYVLPSRHPKMNYFSFAQRIRSMVGGGKKPPPWAKIVKERSLRNDKTSVQAEHGPLPIPSSHSTG